MARFEKGRGTRKRTVTINQIGALLTKDEIDGVSEMLTGYWRLRSENAARTELVRESMALIEAGLTPVDDAAREIAALLPKKAKSKKAILPIRQDVYVYNEATGMMLTSKRMAGKYLEEGSPQWHKAVEKGDILPLSLIQDDPFTVRVVVGGALETEEDEEWVARIDWHLNVKDGKLVVSGGAPLVGEDYQEDDSYTEQYFRVIEVPKGHYRVSVYSYVPGINGQAVLDHLAGGYGKSEPLGKWFRRSRRGEAFPAWLRNRCIGDRTEDPGYEKEWDGVPLLDDAAWPDYIHFLIHLEPVKQPPKQGLSAQPEEGWFGEAVNGRVPKRCPRGLEGREVSGHRAAATGSWIFAQDAFKLCLEQKPQRISGGPVTLPLEEAALAFQLAWFRTRMAFPGLRAKPPCGGLLSFDPVMPEGVVAVPVGETLNFVFSNDIEPSKFSTIVRELASVLTGLPEETLIEICSTPPDNLPGVNPDTSTTRFEGEIRNGKWEIGAVYPPVSAAVLTEALQLARETLAGEAIRVASAEEGKAILARAKRYFRYLIEDNPGTLQEGAIRLSKQDSNGLAFYGAAAFGIRFADSWSAIGMAEDDTDDLEHDDDERFPGDLDKPVRGPEILSAPSGRVYYQTMALLWNEALAEKIQAEEPKLKGMKFRHVADVLCSEYPNIVVRAYGQPGGCIWAAYLLSAPSTLVLELSSRLADGAALVTSRAPQIGDDLSRKIYRQHVPDGTVRELLAKHEARLLELEAAHGKAVEIVQTVEGLAGDIETALSNQAG